MDTAASRARDRVPRSAFSAAPGEMSGSPAGPEAGDRETRESSFLAPFERVFATLKRMGSNYATLVVLDVRRAAVQFAWLVAGGIFISVLVVTAWLAAVAALCVWLLGDVLTWPGVLIVAAALNIVGAAIVAMRLRAVFQHTPFEATLRHIKSDDENHETDKSKAGAAA